MLICLCLLCVPVAGQASDIVSTENVGKMSNSLSGSSENPSSQNVNAVNVTTFDTVSGKPQAVAGRSLKDLSFDLPPLELPPLEAVKKPTINKNVRIYYKGVRIYIYPCTQINTLKTTPKYTTIDTQ